MLKVHTFVTVRHDIPDLCLLEGQTGVIVHVYGDGLAYEVEFEGNSESAARVETLHADVLAAIGP